MLLGLVLALCPLAWLTYRHWHSTPMRRMYALSLLTLFLTFDLVLFGAFTRLTDSGLGCPDWPGCYGNASPVGAKAAISEAQAAMPTGPVTHGKAWIEMIHRYLASSVGVLIMVLAILSWVSFRAARRTHLQPTITPWWPMLTLVWVCVQGAFGALTVTMKLFPAIVTLHLMGGLTLLALLTVQSVKLAKLEGLVQTVGISSALRGLLWVSFGLLAVQVALGGWVSTNYAVLACSDFPRCQNSWWPDMNFKQGFEIWRELGMTAGGESITFAGLTAIHYVHRSAAFLVLFVLAVLAWRLNRVPALRAQSRYVAILITLQLITGLSNVVFDWPLVAAVLHTGGAGALVVVLAWTVSASHVAANGPVIPSQNPFVPRLHP
jgi:cytochrome c oxidase assembly protein subunit 15